LAAPVLTASLTKLRNGFNTAFPRRRKESDGWIGDTAHQSRKSGHNPDDTDGSLAEYSDADSKPEVRAIDVDKDLEYPGITMPQVIQRILATPNDIKRLKYIIFNGVIWSKTNNWKPAKYTGDNQHTEHAHLSGDPAYDEDVTPWSVETIGASVAETEEVQEILARTRYSDSRLDALAKGRDTIAAGFPAAGTPMWLVQAVKTLDRKADAILLAVQGVNEEQILARINEVAATEAARDAVAAQTLQDVLAFLHSWQSGEQTAEEVLQLMVTKLQAAASATA
jgi:cytidylate kinase